MEIYEQYRPKMDWQGPGYKWYCEPCCRSGHWTSKVEAVKQGQAHDKAKHPAVARMDEAPAF